MRWIARRGAKKWTFKTESRITSSPAVAAGVVYFGSYDGNFYAVDAATGKEKWKFATPGERRFAATHLHGASPVAEVMPDPFDFYLSPRWSRTGWSISAAATPTSMRWTPATGTLKWKFKTGDVVHGSPAIAEGVLFVGSWDQFFYALDAATGKEKWRFKTGEDPDIHNQVGIQSSPAVVMAWCTSAAAIPISMPSISPPGKRNGRIPNKGSWVIASPAVSDGKVYFATSDTGLFHALDAKTGTQIFSIDNSTGRCFLPRQWRGVSPTSAPMKASSWRSI